MLKRKIASIDLYMIKHFGWTQDDVDRYIHQGEASQVQQFDAEQRTTYLLHGGATLRQGDGQEPYDTGHQFRSTAGRDSASS